MLFSFMNQYITSECCAVWELLQNKLGSWGMGWGNEIKWNKIGHDLIIVEPGAEYKYSILFLLFYSLYFRIYLKLSMTKSV